MLCSMISFNSKGMIYFVKSLLCFTFQVLLQSDKVPANFSDRSLLKNLGHWLGLQTLARNKPILMRVMRN